MCILKSSRKTSHILPSSQKGTFDSVISKSPFQNKAPYIESLWSCTVGSIRVSPTLSRFNVPRFYTEPCRSNARVPGGGIWSCVLDISFQRIKALAAIASPSSAERLRTNPRDVIGGGEGREGKGDRRREERETGLKGGIWRGGWFKGERDESWVKGLQGWGGREWMRRGRKMAKSVGRLLKGCTGVLMWERASAQAVHV